MGGGRDELTTESWLSQIFLLRFAPSAHWKWLAACHNIDSDCVPADTFTGLRLTSSLSISSYTDHMRVATYTQYIDAA